MFAVSGILFNHESPRRGFEFVTRKISSHAARIKFGLTQELRLGNLDAKREWGHSKYLVKAMHMMLQAGSPDDYVIGTEESHSVREFVQIAFDHVGLDYKKFVIIDQNYYRPAEIFDLVADASKARKTIGWKNNCQFVELVNEMVAGDLEYFRRGFR
jgi:GDPmannose 4,6-dehydratase